jgi:general stress protein YciG
MAKKTDKRWRGFASMFADKHRQIASLGGSSTPREKRAYFVDRQLAADAGRKGGQARSSSSHAKGAPGAARAASQKMRVRRRRKTAE